MKGFTTNILGIAAVTFLAACSAEISGPAAPPPQEVKTFEHKVAGPNLDGTWVSSCLVEEGSRSYKLTYKIIGQEVNWLKEEFQDTRCYTSFKKTEYAGQFRYNKKINSDIFEVEYYLKNSAETANIHFYSYENLKLANGALYVSEFVIGDSIEPKVELLPKTNSSPGEEPVTQPTPAPEPELDPSLIQAVFASKWSEVKYAFCETQRFATLIDFKSVDLSQVRSGKIILNTRRCNSTAAYNTVERGFTLRGDEKDFYLNIGSDSYVEDNLNGLLYAWAQISGNSGSCYFLKNKGTLGIYNSCK